jgi:hypothetical protein
MRLVAPALHGAQATIPRIATGNARPSGFTFTFINQNKNPILADEVFILEGQEGLEPSTFCLRGRRSNQLSYWPVDV